MKKVSILMAALMATTFWACSDDDELKDPVTQETLSAKWEVNHNDNNDTKSVAEFRSFEFNEAGNYIIEMITGAFYFGSYEITDDQTIQLEDFGTIIAELLDDEFFSFYLSLLDQQEELYIETQKAPEMEVSDRTELMSQTWYLYEYNEEQVEGTEMELVVLFSAAGTYMVNYLHPDAEGQGGLAQWQWKDAEEDVLCYSWFGDPVCSGNNEVDILQLSSDTLEIQEGNTNYLMIPYDGSIENVSASGSILKNKPLKREQLIPLLK